MFDIVICERKGERIQKSLIAKAGGKNDDFRIKRGKNMVRGTRTGDEGGSDAFSG